MITYFPPLLFACTIFLGCVILLLIWNSQNNPNYPFTKGSQSWRWQYRHAEKEPLMTNNIRWDENLYLSEAEKYNRNLFDYKRKFYTTDKPSFISTDLSQLYLCITNEKFKIKFVSRLRNGLYICLMIAFLDFFLGLFISLLCY
jgi:hypothetical protein